METYNQGESCEGTGITLEISKWKLLSIGAVHHISKRNSYCLWPRFIQGLCARIQSTSLPLQID